MLSLLIWSLGLPLGCSSAETASVQAAFVVARDAALAPPPPPREGWKADMLLQLSAPLFERLVLVALQSRGTITRELDLGGGLVLSPSLDVTKARVQASPKCESCMVANLRLEGPLKFQAAALGRGTWPVVVAAKVIVITEPVHKAGVWSLSARTQSVVDVTVRVKGLLPEMGNRRLREWVERELVEMGPKVMGAIPDEYPVAALRLVPAGNALEVQIRSTAVRPMPLAAAAPRPTEGWQLDISNGSAVALARTLLFREGPRTPLKVVGVPESLEMDGDELTSTVRVWRESAGWWRDLQAKARLTVEGADIVVEPISVAMGRRSPGAGWADPLASAGESLMVAEIRDAMARRTAGVRTTELRGRPVTVAVTKLVGDKSGRMVRVSGTLQID